MNLDKEFPSISYMEKVAKKRIPRFAFEYLSGAIGREVVLCENIAALDRIKLHPRYLVDGVDKPNCTHTLFGKTYDAPMAISPIGLTGLVWPKAPEYMAVAAKDYNIPFILSGFSTSSVEDIAIAAGACRWFQHYVALDEGINRDMLNRAKAAGCEVLFITIDIPTVTRREREIHNGLSIPPNFSIRTLCEVLARPRWALATARAGIPKFRNLEPYIPKGMGPTDIGEFLNKMVGVHITPSKLQWFRDNWSGKLVVKGVLTTEDAKLCRDIGVDSIVVSNHGGRQLDAAPTSPKLLTNLRKIVGTNMPMMADGGVRHGLDVARFLASGSDFVLLGRSIMFALAAIGPKGASHALSILKQEFLMTMAQLGCPHVGDLPKFLNEQEN